MARLVAGLGLLLVLSGAALTPAHAATLAVGAADNVFEPRPLTVAVGDTIVWTNTGQRPHTVTADNGSFDSGTLTAGQTFSRTFSAPGTFAYYCTFHGSAGGSGMAGTITVTAAQAPTTTVVTAPPTTAAPVVATTAPPAGTPATTAPATAAPAATVAPATPATAPRATSVPAAPASATPAPAAPADAAAATSPTTAATPLARTGASSLALAFIGSGIVVMGIACLMAAKSPPRPAG